MQTLTLTREGSFAPRNASDRQCKKKSEYFIYNYQIKISCNARRINKETTYIVEQSLIGNFVGEHFKINTGSCEVMCIGLAKALRTWLVAQGAYGCTIYVKIVPAADPDSGSTYAYMEITDKPKKR